MVGFLLELLFIFCWFGSGLVFCGVVRGGDGRGLGIGRRGRVQRVGWWVVRVWRGFGEGFLVRPCLLFWGGFFLCGVC